MRVSANIGGLPGRRRRIPRQIASNCYIGNNVKGYEYYNARTRFWLSWKSGRQIKMLNATGYVIINN